jgi:hypothetical protein
MSRNSRQVHFRDSHDKIVPAGDFCVEDLLTGDDEDDGYDYENYGNSGLDKDIFYITKRHSYMKCSKLYLKRTVLQ